MLAVPAPPHYAQRLRSDDADEVTSWAAQRDGDHSRVVHGAGPYGFQAAALAGETVWLGWARTSLGQTIRARAQQAMLQIPIDGSQQYAFGRRRITVAPGALVFCGPGTEMSRHSGAGMVFAMDVNVDALAAELFGRNPGVAVAWPQFPQALRPSAPLRHALLDSLAGFIRALDPEACSPQQLRCEGGVTTTLADALAIPSSVSKIGKLATQRLADLEAWIDAHLGEAITIGRLCTVARIGERSLQLAFRARRGTSPMRFVCERRLAAAHGRISSARLDEDITNVATGLGFTHLGRFSVAYREAFGESPSRTILRSRGAGAVPHVAASARKSG